MEAQHDLSSDDFIHGGVLDACQLLLLSFAIVQIRAGF